MVNIPKHFLNEEQGFIEELETHPALRLKYNTLYPIILNKYKKKLKHAAVRNIKDDKNGEKNSKS